MNYGEKSLCLVAEGNIKHTMKYVEKASDETLEKNYKNYVTKQLDEVNEQITNPLIKQLSNLMTSLDLIDDGEDLERDLEHNELLKRNVKNVLSLSLRSVPRLALLRLSGNGCELLSLFNPPRVFDPFLFHQGDLSLIVFSFHLSKSYFEVSLR